VLANVLGIRDPRQMTEGLNPRALRMVKNTVKGMRVSGAGAAGAAGSRLLAGRLCQVESGMNRQD
jgi:hypothetical protein